MPEAADGLEAGAGFDAGAGLDAGAVLEAVAGSGAAVLEAVAGSGAAVLEAVAGSGAAVLEAVAGSAQPCWTSLPCWSPLPGQAQGLRLTPVPSRRRRPYRAPVLAQTWVEGRTPVAGRRLVAVPGRRPVAGSEAGGGAGSEAGCGSEAGGGAGSEAGCGSEAGGGAGSEAGCTMEAGGGAGSDAGGGPDAAPTRGIASKRFENFIPCLVPAPRSSCFSLFVAGERPFACLLPGTKRRARRCMSVCTALVTPRTGPLTVVLPCPEESMPTSACAAALLESAWATAIAAQALPINRQAATMQTPAANRKRAAITIRPHQKPLPAKPLPYCGIFHRICGLQGRPRARRSPATHHLRHVEAQFTRSGSTTAFLPTVADIAGLGDVVERAAGALGRPDILVNSRIRPSPPCRD